MDQFNIDLLCGMDILNICNQHIVWRFVFVIQIPRLPIRTDTTICVAHFMFLPLLLVLCFRDPSPECL